MGVGGYLILGPFSRDYGNTSTSKLKGGEKGRICKCGWEASGLGQVVVWVDGCVRNPTMVAQAVMPQKEQAFWLASS